ncbi:MAG: phage holin family protein [Clostridiaceae bacterium]|nr:phage holin family protein [Clostridiaceae bacterium]
MNKSNNLLTVYLASGVIGLISEFLGVARMSYIILLILIILDTLTGVAKAIKLQHFTSKGLQRFLKKAITYTTAIITVRLLEIGILSIYETTMLSQVIAAYLIITESISVLENITVLGVPIPSNFVGVLISYIKIPGFAKMLQMGKERENDISEIDDIINYQIPAIDNEKTRRLLEIKFEVWKRILIQVDEGISDKITSDDILFYKVMSLIEIGFKEMEEQWREEIPREHIEVFKWWHQNRVNSWLNKIYAICYSENSLYEKKEQIIESIVVILYQTIIDAQKGITYGIKDHNK